jgi:hypothetical protein
MPYDFSGLMTRCATQPTSTMLSWCRMPCWQQQYRDAWGWREQLQRMETDWFQPLLQALKQGKISELQLQCHGQPGSSCAFAAVICGNSGNVRNRPPPCTESFMSRIVTRTIPDQHHSTLIAQGLSP